MTTPKNSTFESAVRALRKDPLLGAFVRKHGPIVHRRVHANEAFESLAESIIFQQLSGKAAATILKRFIELFPGKKFPSPQNVIQIAPQKLRSAGLSTQKSTYLKNLATKFLDGTIEPKKFKHMSDEDIIEHVTEVKGIGRWTAQMFLMFTLGRPDILPTGDLGIQKGMKKAFNLRNLPSPERMEKLARPWSGYRSIACFYLWRLVDEA